MSTSQFGELRSLLEREPSAASFDLMIQRLDAAKSDDEARTRAEWLPYIEGRLSQWPDSARQCPKAKLKDYESGTPIWCHLVRALDYEGENLGKKRLDKILSAPQVSHITRLDIRSAKLKWEQIATLAAEATFKLKYFGLRRASGADWDVMGALLGSRMLSETESLSLRGWEKLPAGIATHLITHFPLRHLHSLDVTGGAITSRTFKTLLDTHALDQLQSFRAGIGKTGKRCEGFVELIARHDTMQNLHTLHVNETTPTEIAALTKAEHLSTLRELRIDSPLGREEVRQLLNAPYLVNLDELRLEIDLDHRFDFLSALPGSPVLSNLRTLHLDWSHEDHAQAHEVFGELLQSGALSNLTRLAISVDSKLMLDALLTHSEQLKGVRDLTLNHLGGSDVHFMNSVTDLFSGAHFPELESLILAVSQRDRAIIEALASSRLLGRLKRLKCMGGTELNMARLIKSPHMGCITDLDLSPYDYPMTNTLLPALYKAEHLHALETLTLDSHHRVDDFLSGLSNTPTHHLPEHLHMCHPEDYYLQQLDWF